MVRRYGGRMIAFGMAASPGRTPAFGGVRGRRRRCPGPRHEFLHETIFDRRRRALRALRLAPFRRYWLGSAASVGSFQLLIMGQGCSSSS